MSRVVWNRSFVEGAAVLMGYKLDIGRFPGWKDPPTYRGWTGISPGR